MCEVFLSCITLVGNKRLFTAFNFCVYIPYIMLWVSLCIILRKYSVHGLHSPLFNLYCPPVSTWWLVYFFPKYVSLCMCACVFLDNRVLLLLTWCLHTLFIHFPARDIILLFFRSLQTSIVTTNSMFSLSIHFLRENFS